MSKGGKEHGGNKNKDSYVCTYYKGKRSRPKTAGNVIIMNPGTTMLILVLAELADFAITQKK